MSPLTNWERKGLFANRALVRFEHNVLSHMVAQKGWQEVFFWTMLTFDWSSAAFCIVLLDLVLLKTSLCCGFKIAFIAGKSPCLMVYLNVSFQVLSCFKDFALTKLALICFDIDMFCDLVRPH